MKNYLKFWLIASCFVILGFVGAKVFAESNSVNSGSGSLSSNSPMVVNIGPKGNVLMRGIVVGDPGTDSIKVKSWGGSWDVKISSKTELMSASRVISDFQDGDFVGVLGVISADGNFIVDASIVREWRQKGVQESVDLDHDGISDTDDSDDDNDGISDVNELGKSRDHDNDGVSDSDDSDDDDDGIDDKRDSRPRHSDDDDDNDSDEDDEGEDNHRGRN